MTSNEIKFKLKNTLPSPIFDLIYFLWSKVFLKIFTFFSSSKLSKFKEPEFKKINHDGAEFEILINPKNGTVDKEIFLQGVYEPHFLSIIKENLKEGDTFVDVGANIGQHSLFASQIVGESGKVIAFEPIERIFEQFLESVKKNNIHNIFVHNNGCGEKEEKIPLYSTEENIGASSVYSTEGKSKIGDISVVVPDNILKNENKVDFIKIDVEGYELEVIKGLKEILSKHKPKIFIEYSPYYYRLSDAKKGQEILSLLENYGYKMYDVEEQRSITQKDYDYYEKKGINQTNLLCQI